jgi:arginyl-tRNA synthetase
MIRDALQQTVREALRAAGLPEPPVIVLDVPKQREHGDFSTPVALQLAKAAKAKPREIAERLRAAIEATASPLIERVEIAGPGFCNFFLAPAWLSATVRDVVAGGDGFGTNDSLAGARINLEFVSANPTGPLHAGGGRWVATGDAIANLLAAQGAEVHREYYLNDAGTQLDVFGASLYARYCGNEPPEDGYRGEYLVEMAARLRAELGDHVTQEQACEWGYHDVVRMLREDLGRIGVYFDTWFSERLLHSRGDVTDVLRQLAERDLTYEQDGATWLRTTDFGDTRDRVLIRSNGTTTYLANDLAYHRDKLRRGWTHLIDIWGADHHGQVKSLQSGMHALGFGTEAVPEPEVILGQLVKLLRGGQEVRMSKRAGDIVTLSDILDEVDPDVARMTFLLQGLDTTQTFDLDVVTAQSMENPVYYVQYAHARVASIARRAAEAGISRRALDDVDLSLLGHPREEALLRALSTYPEMVEEAAVGRAPQKVATWVRDFAREFHGFYRDCRVISPDDALTQARLWLTEACRIGLANALALLGVHAPDEMARLDDSETETGENETSENEGGG